ncbi:MAG: hypothetical protein IKB88_10345 [Clostridia bacterium]|nr:hypothetical protein [Clostridia bacterium]
MKKSTRILAILMAFAMLIGSFSVLGNAYQAYKNDGIEKYNDVDAPVFELEQYATMALDEIDRMLAKEQISLNIYIGVLNLGSVTETIASVESLLSSVSTLLPLLGDAQMLKIDALEGDARGKANGENTDDLEIIYDLLDFLSSNAEVFEKYVKGELSLGIMNSFIASFLFDVRELAIGLIYSFTNEGQEKDYDYFDNGADGIPVEYLEGGAKEDEAIISLGQILLNELVLGEWVLLDDLFADPDSWVDYEDYKFSGEMNTDANDYYGWVHPKQWVTYALGGEAVVAAGATAPAPIYDVVDITTDTNGYDFIERLMQCAYNELLVPVLNRDTAPWLRRLCGVVYLDKYNKKDLYDEATQTWVPNPDYNPNYKGEPLTDETRTVFADIFNIDVVVEEVTIPAGETFVDNFNDILGDFINNLLITNRGVENEDGYSWDWVYGNNSYLLTNVANVAKYILLITGGEFFPGSFDMPTAAEINGYTDQQVVALIMRGILNGSVDYIYIDESAQSIVDVGYAAVEQLAWQDIPQHTYTKPVRADFANDFEYYDAVVQAMLDILLDIAVYNLNQGLDMVPADGNDPAAGTGLIPYQGKDGSYENTLIQIVAWATSTYGDILALDFECDNNDGETTGLTIDDVWADLDTLLTSIIPIKGENAWIYDGIANSEYVIKTFIFDYLLKPIYTLDATNIGLIFKRSAAEDAAFNTMNGVEIIMSLLSGIFDILFPNVFPKVTTIDAFVQNDILASFVYDLIKSLGRGTFTGKTSGVEMTGRAENIAAVALPVVCMILGLSNEQEFSEMENFLPQTIAVGDNPTFRVYNGSSGVNTGWTNAAGTFTQDQLYKYQIGPVVIRSYVNGVDTMAISASGIKMGDILDGGQSVDVTLQGDLVEGMLIEMNIDYYIKGEDGDNITDTALTNTVYAVVGNTDKDDDAIEISDQVGNRFVQYESEIYLGSGDDLSDITSYQIRVKDSGENKSQENPADTGSVSITSVSGQPFVTKNPESGVQKFKGQEGIYFFDPFAMAVKADGSSYERFEYEYEVDENGELVLDENGEPNPIGNNGGIVDGKYTVTTAVNVNGTNHNVVTNIHLYNDFGLEGLFNREVGANRQQNDYNMTADNGAAAGLWIDYVDALKDAAVLVLTPKTGANFESKINNCDAAYENLYEQYATALEDALEALSKYERSAGVGALKTAVKRISGENYIEGVDENGYPYRTELEYWEDDYVFFSMRDFAPHSYTRYRDARGNANDLIYSQTFYVNAPFEEGYEPTAEEIGAYNDSVLAYEEAMANRGTVGAIEATYALHKLELMASRLIRIKGNTDKLQKVYDMFVTNGNVNASGASYYTADSWEDYTHAKDFARATLDMSASTVEPSRINTATTELTYAYKRLVKSCDFTSLDAALELSADAGALGLDQNQYEADTYAPFYEIYLEAKNFDRGIADTEENQAEIDALALELTNAFNALVEKSADIEPEYPLIDPDVARNSMMFHSLQWDMFFAPWVDSEAPLSYLGNTMSDGSTVDGYIFGLGLGIGADELGQVFDPNTLVNVTVEIIPNSETEMYGTGSEIWLYNEQTGEKIAAYQVVIRGDVNGDAAADGLDSFAIEVNEAYLTDWAWATDGSNCSYYYAAGDITEDYTVDSADSVHVSLMEAYLGDVNQETGETLFYF